MEKELLDRILRTDNAVLEYNSLTDDLSVWPWSVVIILSLTYSWILPLPPGPLTAATWSVFLSTILLITMQGILSRTLLAFVPMQARVHVLSLKPPYTQRPLAHIVASGSLDVCKLYAAILVSQVLWHCRLRREIHSHISASG